jgi:hypothetical protein
VHLVRAVSFYRSKFLDGLRGVVANSYPNVDLLWDNVITGPWGTQKCLTADPWSLSAGHEPTAGADHEEIDERAALCCAKKGGQGQGQARARQIGHSGGARARSRNSAAVCGPAFNDAPSYRAAEAPIGREVQREVLSTMVPDEIERGEAVVIAGDSSTSNSGTIGAVTA